MPLFVVDYSSLEEFLDSLELSLTSTLSQINLQARLMVVRLRWVVTRGKRMVTRVRRVVTSWKSPRCQSEDKWIIIDWVSIKLSSFSDHVANVFSGLADASS